MHALGSHNAARVAQLSPAQPSAAQLSSAQPSSVQWVRPMDSQLAVICVCTACPPPSFCCSPPPLICLICPRKTHICCHTSRAPVRPSSCVAGEPFESSQDASPSITAASRAVPLGRATAILTRARCHSVLARSCAQAGWAAPSARIAQRSPVSRPGWMRPPDSFACSAAERGCTRFVGSPLTDRYGMCQYFANSVTRTVFTDTRASVRHARSSAATALVAVFAECRLSQCLR